MEFSHLNPHIRYAKIHYSHTKSQVERSVCYDCRLFFVVKGSASVDIGDKNYHISNNTALYLPPESVYRFSFQEDDVEIIVLDFDLTDDYIHIKSSLGVASESTFLPERVPKYQPPEELIAPIVCILPSIQSFLKQCTDHFLKKGRFYRESASALLKLCLIELVGRSDITPYTALCEKVLTYIHEHYAEDTLTNAEISEVFNYHPYHLNRIIKQETGKTLHQYLIQYRVRVAKNLLLTTQNNIEQISWQCGFCSPAYFIKTFKDHTGETPKNYRKLHIYTEL